MSTKVSLHRLPPISVMFSGLILAIMVALVLLAPFIAPIDPRLERTKFWHETPPVGDLEMDTGIDCDFARQPCFGSGQAAGLLAERWQPGCGGDPDHLDMSAARRGNQHAVDPAGIDHRRRAAMDRDVGFSRENGSSLRRGFRDCRDDDFGQALERRKMRTPHAPGSDKSQTERLSHLPSP